MFKRICKIETFQHQNYYIRPSISQKSTPKTIGKLNLILLLKF